jgi:small subunit ribosomal protein S19e
MVTIYDIPPRQLIDEIAKELKKMPEMAPPEWAEYVKTGVNKERPPVEKDWWYVRSAAVLRTIYRLGPIGVSKLRTKYGGRKNRGYAPDKTFKGSGNILRKILQKLEIVGFVKQGQAGIHKGRIMTPKGRSFIDKLAGKLKPAEKKAHKKTEVKAAAPAEKETKAPESVKPKKESEKVEEPKAAKEDKKEKKESSEKKAAKKPKKAKADEK